MEQPYSLAWGWGLQYTQGWAHFSEGKNYDQRTIDVLFIYNGPIVNVT